MSKSEQVKRLERLEEILKKEAHVSFEDKLKDVFENLKDNIPNIIPLGVSLGLGAVGVWGFYELIQHTNLVNDYRLANDFLDSFYNMADFALKNGIKIDVSSEILDYPRSLIEQNSHLIYTEEAKTIVAEIDKISDTLSQGTINESTIDDLNELKYNSSSLGGVGKIIYLSLGSSLSGLIGIFNIPLSVKYFFKNCRWEKDLELEYNQDMQESIKINFPRLKTKFENHPYAEKAYDFLDSMVDEDLLSSEILSMATLLADHSAKRYGFVFDEINSKPTDYMSLKKLESAFLTYDQKFV
jgi:hypothetical protein